MLDVALMHWSDHNQAAIYELEHGTEERAAIRATLAAAAAQVAQVLTQQLQVQQDRGGVR